VLIHWRYQVALLKHLNGPDIDTYLDFGLDFMTDPDNLEVPSRRERKTLMVRSLLNIQPPQPEWDEAKTEDESGVITMDVCGHKVQSKVQVGVNVRTVEVLQQGYLIPPVDQHTGVVRRVQGIPIVHGPLPSHSCC
jgi:hypothetical protein